MKRAAKAFKKYFIPHEDNDHQPHLLRWRTVGFVALIAVAAEAVFLFGAHYAAPRSKLFGVVLVNALVDETNESRTAADLPALRVSPLLNAAAEKKAQDMVANGYFAHTSPAGITPWYWFGQVGYNFSTAGENLAVNFVNSEDVTQAWMNSPDHRANILNDHFTEIGMAVAQGTYKGQDATFVVELFGTPAVAPVAFADAAVPAKSVTVPAPKPIAKTTVKPKAPVPPVVVAVVPTSSVSSTAAEPAFVAVRGAEAVAAALPAETAQSNPVQRLLADPKALANDFYWFLLAIFALGLGLHIFVKREFHHPKLIFAGLLMIVVVGVLIIFNQNGALLSSAVI